MNTTNTTAAVVDLDQLEAACDGDADLRKELLEMYFGQADEIMADLCKAVTEQSASAINHLAHKLAGSSLACGLSAPVPALRRMEMTAKTGETTDGAENLAEVQAGLVAVRAAMQVYLTPS